MALKHKIEKLEDVAEAFRPLYEAGTGGFFLQVEGMVPKAQLDEFRNNNIQLNNKLTEVETKFKDVDVVKYRELLAVQGKTPEEIEAAVKARVTQLVEEHTAVVNDLTGKLTTATSQLSTVLVDGELRSEAAKAGIRLTAMDDVILRGRIVFRAKDGKLEAVDGKGEKLYDKDGTSPLAVGSWLKDLKKSAPHLFEGMSGGGGKGDGGGGAGGGKAMKDMSATEKIAAGLAALNQ